MKKTHFVFLIDDSAYRPMYEAMLADAAALENVTILADVPNNNRIKDLLQKNKVRKLSGGCLDWLAYEKNALYRTLDRLCPVWEQVVVVCFNAAFKWNPYVAGTLKRYQRIWKNLRYVLFYLDITTVPVSKCANYLREEGVFDLVYSIDSGDTQNYNLLPYSTFYSADEKLSQISPSCGLYFCGVDKGRQEIIGAIAENARQQDISYKIDLVCYNDCSMLEKYQPSLNLLPGNQFLPYCQVLENELHAHCILDIVQPGQKALTLRPYEAVVYNRKLLSNNRGILDFPFYNPAYMQYFESVDQIDWAWVKDDSPVDYRYNGSFSPLRLMDDISRRLDNTQ